jgi:hypothetical protein
MGERARPDEDGHPITLDALHSDYEVWCESKRLQAMSMDAFAQAFESVRDVPELAGNIKRVGDEYYGIKLKIARLPVRRGR